MADEYPTTQRYYANRKLAAQVYVESANKTGRNIPEYIRRSATESIPSKFTGMTQPQAGQYIADLKEQNKRLNALNERFSQMHRDMLKRKIEAGQGVTSDQLRLAKTTRHDLEMEIKLDKIREDPEKYYQEARKQARKDIAREDREEMFRPLKKLLDWILRRR